MWLHMPTGVGSLPQIFLGLVALPDCHIAKWRILAQEQGGRWVAGTPATAVAFVHSARPRPSRCHEGETAVTD